MLAFSPIGGPGLLVILVVALLLFGNRLPEVARSMGRAMNEFKRGMRDVTDDVDLDLEDKKDPDRLKDRSSRDENTVSRDERRGGDDSAP